MNSAISSSYRTGNKMKDFIYLLFSSYILIDKAVNSIGNTGKHRNKAVVLNDW